MHIILGGTGQVGSATARALLARGEPVTVVTREAAHASRLAAEGARVAEADIRDMDRLRDVLRSGRRAFLLSPPAAPATDTDAEEHKNIAAILAALDGSGLEKVVAASTYGARSGERVGDMTVLHAFEKALREQAIPAAINRGAYYMGNWAAMLPALREGGPLTSLFPADLDLPMVAAEDLGEAAADRMTSGVEDVGIRHVEGPGRYTPRDVAEAFGRALRRDVDVAVVPPEAWEETFRSLGFSAPAAASYARMIAATVEGAFPEAGDVRRGRVTLGDYVAALVGAG